MHEDGERRPWMKASYRRGRPIGEGRPMGRRFIGKNLSIREKLFIVDVFQWGKGVL